VQQDKKSGSKKQAWLHFLSVHFYAYLHFPIPHFQSARYDVKFIIESSGFMLHELRKFVEQQCLAFLIFKGLTCFVPVFVKEQGDEFPRSQSCYDSVLGLLSEMIQLIKPYITQGIEGEELAPQYFLNAAGNLVDIVNSDLADTSAADVSNVSRVIGRRTTIERTVQLIDRIMIVIFQVSIIITFTS